MQQIILIALFLMCGTTFAGENHKRVPAGTLASARQYFDISPKIELADLKKYPTQLSCTIFDRTLETEFTETRTVNLVFHDDSVDVVLGATTTHKLFDQGVDLQAHKTLLLGHDMMDMFLELRRTRDGELILKASSYRTSTGQTEYFEGVVYLCH